MLTVKLNNLRAVAHAMATKDVRYYLNGVYAQGNGALVRVTATDGHRLHMADATTGEPVGAIESVIVPADIVKAVLKAANKFDETVTLEQVNATRWVAKLASGLGLEFSPIDGRFPDYTRVIPQGTFKPEDAKPGSYEWDYLTDVIKGYADYVGEKKARIYIHQRGTDSAIASCAGFTAVVMPMRVDAESVYVDTKAI